MRFADNFFDYELLDVNKGNRLERWGNIFLVRPDPQAIWQLSEDKNLWKKADAVYHRSSAGGGYWEVLKKVPDVWSIEYQGLKFNLKPMGFKHTGLFPEQAVNWSLMQEIIKKQNRPVKVLNLFAYTGGATLACLKAGASVTHVDASKGMVAWAKENAAVSGLSDKPVRWLVDDCKKFVEREIRRGNKYDGIVMDPPSYGRGPNGEVWKLENNLEELLKLTSGLLSDNPIFFLLNTYTAGMSSTVLNYMVEEYIAKGRGSVATDEIGLKVTKRSLIMPAGNTTVWKMD
ncbi:MAG: class I SAM-dependent methyltransferase [Acutalibacteraceae bacterium]|nr:class I SAM-dependent methyltransferase [Acutalibacteraceae bacterium]